ncbi:hypothetical protein GCM10023192_38000 [Amycolatopsis samaneae]
MNTSSNASTTSATITATQVPLIRVGLSFPDLLALPEGRDPVGRADSAGGPRAAGGSTSWSRPPGVSDGTERVGSSPPPRA